MEYMLFLIIIAQFLYIFYTDAQNRKERDKLTLKLMSRDVNEYKYSVEEQPKSAEKEEEVEYKDIQEADVDEVLK